MGCAGTATNVFCGTQVLSCADSILHWSPDWLSLQLTPNLKKLSIAENHLKELPKELIKLKNLEYLYINDNPIEKLPEGFEKLTNLKILNIQKTKIKELPNIKQWYKMKKLKSVYASKYQLDKEEEYSYERPFNYQSELIVY